jgi:hypothetical protein
MKDAGFVDIVEKRYKLPVGGWSSDPKYREIGIVSQSPLCSLLTYMGLIVSASAVCKVLADRNGRLDLGSCPGVS